VFKAFVVDVIIQKQHVNGYEHPPMFAGFAINALPARCWQPY
jgi:hypothetical protein